MIAPDRLTTTQEELPATTTIATNLDRGFSCPDDWPAQFEGMDAGGECGVYIDAPGRRDLVRMELVVEAANPEEVSGRRPRSSRSPYFVLNAR
jgi:hypothetical protein